MDQVLCILICDDNPTVHETIGTYIKAEGMHYACAYDGEEALSLYQQLKPDFVVLDLMMPKMNGLDVCRALRKLGQTPILMLTAKGEEIDRIIGLEIGADDYVVKPFSPREVVTRIKTILRRSAPPAAIAESEKSVRIKGLTVDLSRYVLSYCDNAIEATPKEIEILYLLASNIGRVFDREQILSLIWGYDYLGDTRAVDTHVKRLRKKLPPESAGFTIRSIYGIGYKFEVTP